MSPIEELLSSLLDRLGKNWKSTTGLFLMALISLLGNLNYLSPDQATKYLLLASTVFGIGLFHKAVRKEG